MSLQVIDSATKTTVGILNVVDHTVDSLQYLAIMAKDGLKTERRDQLTEGFKRANEQDKGNDYNELQLQHLANLDSGIVC